MIAVGPFWRYYGGKWRAAPRYPRPAYGHIIEPFAGAAGYACRYPDLEVTLIDKSPAICGIWRWLIGATADDVLAVPDVPEGGTVDDIDAPQGARDLVGFWCNNGSSAPRKRPTEWAKSARWMGGWGRGRARVAADVSKISHWTVIEGEYSGAPDLEATWFIDPPYQTSAGRYYPFSDVDYPALGEWAQQRRGQVMACDQQGADWLPWNGSKSLKSNTLKGGGGRSSEEVVYIRNDAQMSLLGRT